MRSLPQQQAWARVVVAAGLLALAACSSPPHSATSSPSGTSTEGVAINHVDNHYIDETAFQRISEAFTHVENKSGRIIERTDPQQRAGYYFIIDLAWHPSVTLPAGTQAILEYVRNDNPVPQKERFVFPDATGTWPEILIGLTGAKWPNKDLSIVAYKLTLEDASGKLLASRQSFLWGMPAETTASAVTAADTAPITKNP